MDKNSLLYISGGELKPGMPMHIKTNNEQGGAVLAFSSLDAGKYYLESRYEKDVYSLSPITGMSDEYYKKIDLLVFNSKEEIMKAYENQNEHDFTKHLVPWPND